MLKLVSINSTGKFMSQLKENQKALLEATGIFLEDKMQYYAPVDTGYLRSRCAYVIQRNELFLYNDCHYAIHQEYGTRFQPGTPFFRPAVYNHIAELKELGRKYMSNGLD